MTENDGCDRSLKAGHVQRLLLIDDSRDWGGGLELRDDGIYRRALDADALATLPLRDQAAARGAGAGLVLRLPCALDQFKQFVADEGLADAWVLRRIALLRAIAGSRARQGEAMQQPPAGPQRRRAGHLDALEEMARRRATDPNDWASVWVALVELAQSDDRPAPLVGYAEGDLKYQSTSGEVAFLTRDQFRDRLRKRHRG
jgi:hypothetical protein